MLKALNLNAGYGEIRVLWDLNLEIGKGEIVSLLGANGSGKSTLLATICGLIKPLSGEIYFLDEAISGMGSDEIVKRGICQIPEGRRIFSGMTVRENLMIGAFVRNDHKKILQDLEWVLNLFPILKDRRTQLGGTLSGGEQQMCAIGRGLMARPRLLIIDELSLGLGPIIVDELMRIIDTIHLQEGTAILLVEQDVELALQHSQRGYVLETGRIVLSGPAQELLNNPHIKTAYLGI